MRFRGVVLAVAATLPSCGGSPTETMQPSATITVSPAGTGIIANATSVSLRASGSGVAPLSHAWMLGDGSEATGPEVSHVFRDEGTYTVTLTTTDGDGQIATASAQILARRLDGTWRMRQFGWRFELIQQGTSLSGRVIGQDDTDYSGVVPLVGRIEPPNLVSFSAPGFTPVGFTGSPDVALDTLTGTADFAVPRAESLDRTSVLPPNDEPPPAPTPTPTPAPPLTLPNQMRIDFLMPPVGSTLREGDTITIDYTYRKADEDYWEGLALIRDDGREYLDSLSLGGRLDDAKGLYGVTLLPINGVLGFARGHTIDALWVVGPLPLRTSDSSIVWSNVAYSQPIELRWRVE